MAKKEMAWFVRDWLLQFETNCSISNWQRGKTIQRQGKVFFQGIEKGRILGYVKENGGWNVEIESKASFSQEEIEEIELILSTVPSLLMQTYGKSLTKEDVEEFPHQLGFELPQMEIKCKCHEPSEGFCSHIVALAIVTASEFEANFSQFLRFNGINWDSVLMGIEEVDSMWLAEGEGGFSLVPIPDRPVPSFESRMGSTPSFWTSSFPFNRMLEEIYARIREDAMYLRNRK